MKATSIQSILTATPRVLSGAIRSLSSPGPDTHHGSRYYLYKDRTDHVEVIGKDVMTQNGHNSYFPGTRPK